MKQPHRPSSDSCKPAYTKKEPQTYAEVVAKFLAMTNERVTRDLLWYAEPSDFATRLEKAVMSRARSPKDETREVRHGHQRRISEDVLRKAYQALLPHDLEACQSFKELHDLIDSATSRISGIGALAVYDFACRIGVRRQIVPEKVYLHSGTRTGANALGLGRGQKTIDVQDLPEAFHVLSAHQVEECLCIYQDDLKRIAPTSGKKRNA